MPHTATYQAAHIWSYLHITELGENPVDIEIMDIVNHIVAQVQEGKWDPAKLSLVHQMGTLVGKK
ncbi:MAG: hypothetical protein AAGA62_00505 [Bacteroidota bacterium]